MLLNAALDTASRLSRLHLAGAAFVGVVILSNLIGTLKDYRQRLPNARVMLSLRRWLYQRLLHLPLPQLWDVKTGGILSRLTGDVETTTGLLQTAIVSPTLSLIRLVIAVAVLLALNWRLGLTAMAMVPAAILISLTAARRVRPVYRSVRKDAEQIDGRVGEAVSGIRVVRAFRREMQELFHYMLGRHTVLRKELFAHRRRRGLHRRHHGLSVVHVPPLGARVEHRQLPLRAATVARGDGARVRSAGDARRQAGPA